MINVRHINVNDYDAYIKIYSDSENLKYEHYSEFDRIYIESRFQNDINSSKVYAIEYNHLLVGIIRINMSGESDEWYLGVVVNRDYQRLGIAHIAVEKFLYEIFQNQYGNIIYALCADRNEKAKCSLVKNGFVLVENYANQYYYKDNESRIICCDLLKYKREL